MNVNAPLSGMNAAQTRLDVAANNIANLSTNNFTRKEVVQTDLPQAGTKVADVRNTGQAGSNLEADMVEQIKARNTYMTNLSVFKSNNDMLMGTIIDINA
ncbi:MAG: flagellar basal body rod protein [Methylotenera sp.]|uniref:flagellar basal body protein n=1 Tax=Methylotenera sp. TaxID=2051956 RepID=UPI000D4C0032|nr:flagellar basal body protein [Methylotenera sp.]PPC81063.1 MAG: flagellar basal body rod protein [Methylotenera sp.]